MIKNNLRMTLFNSKFLMCMLGICLFTIMLYAYQDSNDKLNGEWYNNCLNSVLQSEQYSNYISDYRNTMYETGEYYTDGIYNELNLLDNVEKYINNCDNYDKVKSELCKNALFTSNYNKATISQRFIAREKYEKYNMLSMPKIVPGNYVGYEHFFSYGVIDFSIIIIIFLTVYFVVIVEREKGIGALVFSTKYGGTKYYFVKLISTIIISSIAMLVMYLLKAWICFERYGCGDLSVSIQSINGYIASPFDLTIGQYLIIFIVLKLLAVCVLSAVLLLVSALSINEVISAIIVVVLLGVGVVFNKYIDPSSTYSYIRDSSLISLMNISYVISAYRIYVLGPVFSFALVVHGFDLYITVSFILFAGSIVLGIKQFNKGLRKSGKSLNYSINICHYKMGLFGNEMQLTFAGRKCLAAIVIITCFVGITILDFGDKYDQEYIYERSMVTYLNDMPPEEAKIFIFSKQEELNHLSQDKDNAFADMLAGVITDEAYEEIQQRINAQLVYKPIVDQLCEQAVRIEKDYKSRSVKEGYEITRLSDALVGEGGRGQRILISLVIAFYISFVLLSTFPMEKNKEMPKLLSSMPAAVRGLKYRVYSMMLSAFFIALLVNGMWLISVLKGHGVLRDSYLTINNQSMNYYNGLNIQCSIGASLMVDILWQAIKWAIISGILIVISSYFSKAVWGQLIGIGILITPLILAIFEMRWIEKIPYYRFMVLGLQSAFYIISSLIVIVLLIVLLFVIDRRMRRWIAA